MLCVCLQSKDEEDEFRDKIRQSSSSVSKIKSALDFMRNKQLEVPFIASYKKECIVPELTSNALWRIYKWDEKVGQALTGDVRLRGASSSGDYPASRSVCDYVVPGSRGTNMFVTLTCCVQCGGSHVVIPVCGLQSSKAFRQGTLVY